MTRAVGIEQPCPKIDEHLCDARLAARDAAYKANSLHCE
jgi:hypothetical protein